MKEQARGRAKAVPTLRWYTMPSSSELLHYLSMKRLIDSNLYLHYTGYSFIDCLLLIAF